MATESSSAVAPNRDANRIPAPFEPPNPYDIMSRNQENEGRESATRILSPTERPVPWSPDTVNPLEHQPNQAPQVVMSNAPEVVSTGDEDTQINKEYTENIQNLNAAQFSDHDDNLDSKGDLSSKWQASLKKHRKLFTAVGLLIVFGVALGVPLGLRYGRKESVTYAKGKNSTSQTETLTSNSSANNDGNDSSSFISGQESPVATATSKPVVSCA